MIQELTEHDAVQEVKQINAAPQEHAVAIRGQETYQDPGMKLATGNVVFPQPVLDLIEEDEGWKQTKITFRTSGEYAGCFTIRIEET